MGLQSEQLLLPATETLDWSWGPSAHSGYRSLRQCCMNLHWSSAHPWNRRNEFGSGFGDVIVSREYSESVVPLSVCCS